MARWQDAPFIGGAYSDDTRPFSVQDTVNQLVVPAEKSGTRSAAKLRGVPGMQPFVDLGTNSSIRGMRNVEGALFVVSAQTLFRVLPSGSSQPLGTIPGVSRVSMTHNQVAGGNQVVIGNGQSGYCYDTSKSTFQQITGNAFLGFRSVDYIDSYIVGISPFGDVAYTSGLADALSYSTLDRYDAEGSPDKMVANIVTHREWWLLGEQTIEPFVDNPQTDSAGIVTTTFQRSSGVVIERGVASTFCAALIDNTVMFLGNDGIVYKMNAYTPVRVSTHAIEEEIQNNNWQNCFAMVMESQGHKVYYLTFPDGLTWGYDCATGEWHRRQSYGMNRWRANAMVSLGQKVVVGDFANGRLYALDWEYMQEDQQPLVRERIGPVYSDSQNPITMAGFEVVVDTGASPGVYGTGTPPAPMPLTLTGTLANGTIGAAYSSNLIADGGLQPYAWSILTGTLPPGLSLNAATGIISGTPT